MNGKFFEIKEFRYPCGFANVSKIRNSCIDMDTSEHPVLLFDGVCNFCNASVQWVLQHDRQGVFHFASLQSEAGRALLKKHDLDPQHFDSVVVVDGPRCLLRSDAAFEILRRIGGPWRALTVLQLLPRSLRDAVYDWIARNRYRWWGKREACMIPRPEWKERFLTL